MDWGWAMTEAANGSGMVSRGVGRDGPGRADRAAPAAVAGMRQVLTDVGAFGAVVLEMPLRAYQLQVARAVLDSIAAGRGLTFTVMMVPKGYAHPRAAGRTASPAAPGPRLP